ncbi:MAG: biopolymer transporter ExbD [Proteobacteria bacterium]|nr:biopolymer transporter ExbD [Pseudomonadota bacterium]MBU1710129.1 biopolymer transporter ExbD [Pseudomonadota bacterium]
MRLSIPVRRKARIEMLPLIDIVFLLLVVFIYAMLSMAVHRGLPVDLPSSAAAIPEKNSILSVTIQAPVAGEQARIFVDETPVVIGELSRYLQVKADEMRRSQPAIEPGVLFFADSSIDYQQIFNMLDRINQAGLSRISMQADDK